MFDPFSIPDPTINRRISASHEAGHQIAKGTVPGMGVKVAIQSASFDASPCQMSLPSGND